jgi:hypothetical protein
MDMNPYLRGERPATTRPEVMLIIVSVDDCLRCEVLTAVRELNVFVLIAILFRVEPER